MPDVLLVVQPHSGRLVRTVAGRQLCLAGAISVLSCLSGCVGVFASDGLSLSLGNHGKGALTRAVAMPFEGSGYEVHPEWRVRDRRYSTGTVVRWLTEVFRNVDRLSPGNAVYLGDLSGKNGGGAAMHRSHASGRDIDIFYVAGDQNGQPLHGLPAMLHFTGDGRALRWSVAKPGRTIKEPVPIAHFDSQRNWAVVRSLIETPGSEVQWIFVQRDLAALLLAEAEREGTAPSVIDRARALLHQPTDAQPHDDHMHVRVFCDPGERAFGCTDKGPRRWLKKHWKYMRGTIL